MINEVEFVVDKGGVRLDAALLSRFPSSTRAFCKEACQSGNVLVNGRNVVKGTKLRGGETIFVKELAEIDDNRVMPDKSVRVHCVFEDEDILAFDKPASQPVQPLSRHETGTLMNGVVARWPDVREIGDSPLIAGAVHRIDAGTSGLVLVARSNEVFNSMRDQFAARSVKKTYLALVEGMIAVGGTLEHDLAHDPSVPFCRMVDASRARFHVTESFHAVTSYQPIGFTKVGNEDRTLLEVTILTGVTHQIRAQLSFAGIHIINDRLYGAFAIENQEGHCLHALAASFVHPVKGVECQIRTSYPEWARIER
jgi:23S rRNA pseudouridine1911/1915/1917 synthase